MLLRLCERIRHFMAGRYGGDALGRFLLWSYLLVCLVRLPIRQPVVSLALYVLSLLLLLFVFARALSRDIPRRQRENERYLRLAMPVRQWLRRQFDRVRYVRRWRFRRCPYCRADLRLPIRRGRRTVTCFRCRGRFKAFFL